MEEEKGNLGSQTDAPARVSKKEGPSAQPEHAYIQPKITIQAISIEEFLKALAAERKAILDNQKFTAKQKIRLLDENRKTLVVATGGIIRKTETVVYAILGFGAIVFIVLALLTTCAKIAFGSDLGLHQYRPGRDYRHDCSKAWQSLALAIRRCGSGAGPVRSR